MACGLPVLVSRLCGSGFEMVDEGHNGFRFDPYDSAALSELMARMSSLTSSEYQQMSRRSEEIVSHFAPELWAKELVECINTIAS
jgi:glycosyltransferase involved in cell wall biosynthesis